MTAIRLDRIGPLVRERRGDRGIREIAAEVGVSAATLSRIENGKLPDLDTFGKLCRWLDVDPRTILGCQAGDAASQVSNSRSGTLFAHWRADRALDPALSQALAEMMLLAQQMMVSVHGRPESSSVNES